MGTGSLGAGIQCARRVRAAACRLRGKRKVSTSDSGRADPAQVRRGAPAACGYVPATRSAPRSKSKRTMKRTPPGPGAPGRAVLRPWLVVSAAPSAGPGVAVEDVTTKRWKCAMILKSVKTKPLICYRLLTEPLDQVSRLSSRSAAG